MLVRINEDINRVRRWDRKLRASCSVFGLSFFILLDV